jgi:hypothetical protein
MNRFHLFKCLFFLPFVAACQTIKLDTVCRLPQIMEESSGLVVESNNRFWTHNDSNDPRLYQFDSTGLLLRTVVVRNGQNIDWEEIALDPQKRYFYIADFGNNAHNRRNLRILKISLPTPSVSLFNRDTVDAEIINFQYEDQTAFPPADSLLQFDAEAMIATADSLYIFTKDFNSKPYQGKTRLYRLPTTVGTHTARLIQVISTDNSWQYNGAVTASARAIDGTLALLTYQKLFVFTGYPNQEFTRGRRREFSFGLSQFAQREALAFAPNDNCIAYMTSERASTIGGGNLTRFNICRLLSKTKDSRRAENGRLRVSPTPSVSEIKIAWSEGILPSQSVLRIYNSTGLELAMQKIATSNTELNISPTLFPNAGFYFCKLFSDTGIPLSMEKIIIQK